jgi:hypothetical protein
MIVLPDGNLMRMNAATAAHYSQPLQPPTATADERVTRPLLPLPPPSPTTTSSDDDDEDDDDNDNDEAANAPDNVPLVDARYSPR